jgi:TfoX/Sxy family transcriptional regulator of competence genes
MAFDEMLEKRIEAAIAGWDIDVPKKKMFGGLGYFINGNMAFGIKGNELIVKAAEEQGNELLKESGMHPFQMGGRPPMKNWYLAGGEAIAEESDLVRLLEISRQYTKTLPPK